MAKRERAPKVRKPFYRRVWFGMLIIFLGIAAIGMSGNESEVSKPEPVKVESQTNALVQTPTKTETPIPTVAESKPAEVKKEDSVPREFKSALQKAQVYSDSMSMSKLGVYDQLTSEHGEGFPADAAQYAVDNVKADWKENAAKKAKIYANEMSMSDSAVYEQLISEYGEQFTSEEARYGVDSLDD